MMEHSISESVIDHYLSVPDDDAPRSSRKKLLNLLGAGALDRKAAKRMRAHSVSVIDSVHEKLEAAKLNAIQVLERFHHYKFIVYYEKVKDFTPAYSFIDKAERSQYNEPFDFEKLVSTLQFPPLNPMPSGKLKKAGGFFLGGAIGSVLGNGLLVAGLLPVSIAPTAIIFFSAVSGMTIAMRVGSSHWARQREAERSIRTTNAPCFLAAISRLRDLEKIRASVDAMEKEISRLSETLAVTQTEVLDPVLEDGSNACKLLTEILDTALLDGEGALLAGVVEKLQSQKVGVNKMRSNLAA